MSKPSLFEVKPYLQPFPYGKEGENSRAARIAKEVLGTEIDPKQPYGEIWIGSTHKNGPSEVMQTGQKLRDLVASDPEYYLGKKLLSNQDMQDMYKNDLPFLFKILSFDKALPLQAHPDPNLGSKLKKQEEKQQGKNEDFVDENGKPEVSVALTDFTGFIGFRPPADIAAFIEKNPQLAELFSKDQVDQVKKAASGNDNKASVQAIKDLFAVLIKLSEDKAKELILKINDKVDKQGAAAVFGDNKDADALAKVWNRNMEVYGKGDVGILVTSFLMNLMQLPPGEGCWILADDIHAYVDGDVIECMANSDNMVCHGLGETEQGGKQTFVDMLSYRHLPASKLTLKYEDGWQGKNGNTRLYRVPITEFDILRISLSPSSKSEKITLPGPHTFVVTEGTVKATVDGETITLKKGHSAFVRPNVELELELVEGEKGEVYGSFFQ
ncbi:RmlC-like cupin [Cystobasidium minutum MCA 4210]|uniref:RmlC-like cupin n=1 Tax=Cystobasidium minutum MCA 4210 TaxID=1397322 RepID=UPI0034CF32F6|eukprot:jgi/Rhomi1/166268/fgenesh1_kg.1_\